MHNTKSNGKHSYKIAVSRCYLLLIPGGSFHHYYLSTPIFENKLKGCDILQQLRVFGWIEDVFVTIFYRNVYSTVILVGVRLYKITFALSQYHTGMK